MIYNYLRIYMLNYFTLYISPWNRAYYPAVHGISV